MRNLWSRLAIVVPAFSLMIGASGLARADMTLLQLYSPPAESTQYTLSFTASDTTTTVSLGGYQLNSDEAASDNGLYLNDTGPNLLGSEWAFTPAAFGSLAFPINDGTSVPALEFEGRYVGYFDTFSQTVVTMPGQSYTLSFLFFEQNEGPSGFVVTTSAAAGVVPEPSSLFLAGSSAVALALARALVVVARRLKVTAGV